MDDEEITGANRLLSSAVAVVMGSCHALQLPTASLKRSPSSRYTFSSFEFHLS
jgi:hypothetical protein